MLKTIPVDQNGYLLPISKDTPASAYRDAIAQIVCDIVGKLGPDTVRSIVLRGSIACHLDIPGISDLDIVIFLHQYSKEASDALERLAAEETARWKHLVSLVDLSCERFDLLTTAIDHNRLFLNLKLTGITLWGEDLIAQLPSIKLDHSLAAKIARQTWVESNQTAERIKNKKVVHFMGEHRGCDFLCVWFMRSFCRGLVAFTMLKEQVFSLHVQTCARLFEKYFPQYADLAKICRELECAPTNDWEYLQDITNEALQAYETLCNELALSEALNGDE